MRFHTQGRSHRLQFLSLMHRFCDCSLICISEHALRLEVTILRFFCVQLSEA